MSRFLLVDDRVFKLLLFFASLVLVPGEVVIRQINVQTTKSWTVRGLATYTLSPPNPPIFYFQCTSTINSGNGLTWSKVGGSLGHTQTIISDGVELMVDPPIANSAGTYICSDSVENESKQFLLTTDDPASLAVNPQQTAYIGDTTMINIYASTLTPLTDNLITWTLNGTALTDASFSNTKTTLTLTDIQASDAGVYALTVIADEGGSTSSSTTTLTVLALPTTPQNITIHTDTFTNGSVGNISWTESSVAPSVGETRYRINISSSALEENIIMESTSNSVMVEGLVPSDDQYCVVVTAIDGNNKTSNGSSPSCFIFNVPSSVDEVEAIYSILTHQSPPLALVVVSWDASTTTTPSDVATPVMYGYRVTISSTDYSNQSGLLPVNTFNYTFTGVPVGDNYTVSVIVVNGVGNSIAVSDEINLPELMSVVSSSIIPSLSSSVVTPLTSDTNADSTHPISSPPSSVVRPSQSEDCRTVNCITVTTSVTIPSNPSTNDGTTISRQYTTSTPLHSSSTMLTRGQVIPTNIVLCSNNNDGRNDRGGVSTSCLPYPSNIDNRSSSSPGQSVSNVVLSITMLSLLLYLTVGLLF